MALGNGAAGPRERLNDYGEEPLSDVELLALLLGTGTTAESVVRLALRLLERFQNLRTLARASMQELLLIPGVGPAKAARLKAGLELSKRLAREPSVDRRRFSCGRDVFEFVQLSLRDLRHEVFEILLLDAKNRLVRHARVSVGTLTGSLVHPREVYRQAILDSAAAIVLVHNHPSGDPTPSREDLDITHRLVDAGDILGIRVIDHVIVGADRFTSLADIGSLTSGKKFGSA